MGAPPAPRPASPLRGGGAGRTRETLLFWIGLALIALHVLDDNVVQPQPGTSPGDHVVSTLVPLVLLAGYGYVTTHVGRAVVPPDHLGVAHEDVTFETADGLDLHGWYIPS